MTNQPADPTALNAAASAMVTADTPDLTLRLSERYALAAAVLDALGVDPDAPCRRDDQRHRAAPRGHPMTDPLDLDAIEREMRTDCNLEGYWDGTIEALIAELRATRAERDLLAEAIRVMSIECNNGYPKHHCCIEYHLWPDLRPELLAAIKAAREATP